MTYECIIHNNQTRLYFVLVKNAFEWEKVFYSTYKNDDEFVLKKSNHHFSYCKYLLRRQIIVIQKSGTKTLLLFHQQHLTRFE